MRSIALLRASCPACSRSESGFVSLQEHLQKQAIEEEKKSASVVNKASAASDLSLAFSAMSSSASIRQT